MIQANFNSTQMAKVKLNDDVVFFKKKNFASNLIKN